MSVEIKVDKKEQQLAIAQILQNNKSMAVKELLKAEHFKDEDLNLLASPFSSTDSEV